MKCYFLNSTDPYVNLACEEWLFRRYGEPIFLLWRNEPTVVIGRNQNADAELVRSLCDERGIHIARRITGGGAVYHDLGNINYSYISEGKPLDFASFSAPVLAFLRSLGLSAELGGRNDILLNEGNISRKISGAAQTSAGGVVLHHGTILFDVDMSVLSRVLRPSPEKLRRHEVASVAARVVNLKEVLGERFPNPESFIKAWREQTESYFDIPMEELIPNEEMLALAKRNASEEYLFQTEKFTHKKTFRTSGGEVQLCFNLATDGSFEKIRFLGDFQGEESIEELELFLTGKRADAAADVSNIGKYVQGLSADMLLGVLKEA